MSRVPHDKRRRLFSRLVLLGALLSIVAGIQAVPPVRLPVYALESTVVYKGEVVLASFISAYLLITAVALAFEGRTVGKISTSGVELPTDLSPPIVAQQELAETLERIQGNLIRDKQDFSTYIDLFCADVDVPRSRSGVEKG